MEGLSPKYKRAVGIAQPQHAWLDAQGTGLKISVQKRKFQ